MNTSDEGNRQSVDLPHGMQILAQLLRQMQTYDDPARPQVACIHLMHLAPGRL